MRSIIQHLRFPFSYLLLPVFLMAYAAIHPHSMVDWKYVALLFIILHILVYPSSNAYNSLQDQDEGSIGLIEKPLMPNKHLFPISIIMDLTAIFLSMLISLHTAILIALYILASRLYSYRKIRLKKYPIIGFLIVFIFQGAWIYFIIYNALFDKFSFELHHAYTPQIFVHYYWAISASFLIGAIYPLSQIYQHESDKKDGVITISYLLGKRGSFIFSGICFLLGITFFSIPVWTNDPNLVYTFILFQLPSLIYFNYWFYKVIKDEREANFKHTMRMNLISATCMNAFFLWMIFLN